MRLDTKKCVFVLALFVVAGALSAQEQPSYSGNGSQGGYEEELDLYYFNLPIVKIFSHPRGYYILYRTSNLKIGEIYVPWEWMDYRDQRAVCNTVPGNIPPYISYITNNGEFFQIKIYGAANPSHSTWGRISSERVSDERFDVDTLALQH